MTKQPRTCPGRALFTGALVEELVKIHALFGKRLVNAYPVERYTGCEWNVLVTDPAGRNGLARHRVTTYGEDAIIDRNVVVSP